MRLKLLPLAATVLVALLPAPAFAHLKAGQVFVVDNGAFADGGVISANPATGKETKVAANDLAVNASSQFFHNLYGIALAPSGKLVLVDNTGFDGNGGVIGVNPASGKETKVSANDLAVNASNQLFSSPSAIVVQPSGRILVTDFSAFISSTGGVIAVNPKNGAESTFSSNALAVNAASQYFLEPISIALSPTGRIYVLDQKAFGGSGGVISVNPATGRETKVAANNMAVNASSQFFTNPYGIKVAPNGRILVLDNGAFANGGVIAVDPATGKETAVSANSMPVNSASQFFTAVEGLALTASGNILVADDAAFGGDGGLISVNPGTGGEARASANNQAVNASSQFFDSPYGVEVVPPPPSTKLTGATVKAGKGQAQFRFRAIGSAATGFQCKLRSPGGAAGSFSACKSPRSYRNLPAGVYTFLVRAVGVAGPDRTPAKRRFRISG